MLNVGIVIGCLNDTGHLQIIPYVILMLKVMNNFVSGPLGQDC
jgi:hypothetical protein